MGRCTADNCKALNLKHAEILLLPAKTIYLESKDEGITQCMKHSHWHKTMYYPIRETTKVA
jgi:hypothetical protein